MPAACIRLLRRREPSAACVDTGDRVHADFIPGSPPVVRASPRNVSDELRGGGSEVRVMAGSGMFLLGLVMLLTPPVLAWRWGPGPTRRRAARAFVALAIVLWMVASNAAREAGVEPPAFGLVPLAVLVGLVITRITRQRRGDWPA